MKIKIVNYNVLNGFCSESKPFVLDRRRVHAAIKLLEQEDPDVLILTEAYFWPFAKKDKLDNYKGLFAQLYNLYSPTPNQFRWAPIVLSRFPVEYQDLTEFHKTFLRATIRLGKNKVFLDVVHPYPDISEQEKAELVSKALKDCHVPYILAGDLNTLSPEDNYNHQRLLAGFQKFMGDKAGPKLEEMFSGKTINTILNRGLVDTYKKINGQFNYTVPTDLRTRDKDSAVRMDYIFCSKQIKVIKSGVIKSKLAEQISDHYPIYAILEV